MFRRLMSASNYTRSIGFHALERRALGVCFILHPSIWLLPSKRRGVGVGCEAPHLQPFLLMLPMDLVPPGIHMNLHMRRFRVG